MLPPRQPPPQGTPPPADLALSWGDGIGVKLRAPPGIREVPGYSRLPTSSQRASIPLVTLTSPGLLCEMGPMHTHL